MTTSEPRCVIDTKVLISGALSEPGKPNRVISYVIRHGTLLASTETFEELASRLRTKPRFRKYLTLEGIEGHLYRINVNAHFVAVTETISACSDPDDDKFLELAVSGNADYLITGNLKDFPPSPFQGIPILSPAEFLETVLRER